MADYFLGEIRIFPMNWPPKGWALCDGATMQVQQSAALYALLGTQFGGNGQTTFQLPDLQGRAAWGLGRSTYNQALYAIGNRGGAETVTLTATTVPAHQHVAVAVTNAGNSVVPAGSYIASIGTPANWPAAANDVAYLPQDTWTAGAALAATTVVSFGSSQPHQNMQPSTVINYSISLTGIFPPRN